MHSHSYSALQDRFPDRPQRAGLPLAGFLYESVAAARDNRRFPPLGSLVDVRGRRLHLICIGAGAPIVLFEASGFSNSVSAATARAEIALHTRVRSYDRMGVGWSNPGPRLVSIGMLADDLRRLQDNAALAGPLCPNHEEGASAAGRAIRARLMARGAGQRPPDRQQPTACRGRRGARAAAAQVGGCTWVDAPSEPPMKRAGAAMKRILLEIRVSGGGRLVRRISRRPI